MNRAALPLRALTIGALVIAGLFLAIRLWSHFCEFPAMVWNDIRVAPAIALAQGWSVYPTAAQGVINTWSYGPLPLLLLLPAAWGRTPEAALLIAGGLNLALILVPLAAVCFAWPACDHASDSRLARTTAMLVCAALWPRYFYESYYCDSAAIAFGLLGHLALIRGDSPRMRWLAAAVSTAAVACKPIALGIPFAQVAWLGLTAGWVVGAAHLARCVVAGLVIAGIAILKFGFAGLWYSVVALPGKFHWAPDLGERLASSWPELVLHLGLPLAAMTFGRRWFLSPARLLPALAWACTLPLSVAALLKFGGRTNSLHGFELWLPAVLVAALTDSTEKNHRQARLLAVTVAAAVIACTNVLRAPRLLLHPDVAAYREAAALAARFRGRIWFPLHPLVTLYSEGRYYHDEDGLYVRIRTQQAIPEAQAAAHLPRQMQMIALHTSWTDWGVARRMLPANAQAIQAGEWTLWSAPRVASPP